MENQPTNDEAESEEVLDRLTAEVLARLTDGESGPRLRYVGDYELEQELARGGMGVVFLARQVSLGRRVALKMILSGRFASAEEVARFRVEAEAAAALSHPGIVAIHEVGTHEGQHYFSMEYVEGRSLAGLGNGAPIASHRAAGIALEIANAVHYAHQAGVLHRDLKPSNVLLDREERVRITDFGLAKRREDAIGLTGTGQILGTPGYMAPEQAVGAEADARADVYAIGAILYELLTGRAPFVGETPLAVLLQVRDQTPVAPSVLNPRVPTDLATIAMKALERSPDKRYADAGALARDLERALASEPIHARPAGRLRRFASWAESNPWWIAGALSLAVALLGVLAYGLFSETQRLQWLVAHPGEAPPERGLGFDDYQLFYWLAFMLPTWLGTDLVRRSTGLPLSLLRDRRVPRVLGRRRVAAWVLVTYGLALVGLFVGSLWFAMRSIDAYVWNDELSFLALLQLFALGSIGASLFQLGREARATLHGIAPQTYSPRSQERHVRDLELAIRTRLRARRFEDARRLTEYLFALYPERPESMEMRAHVHDLDGDPHEAARWFTAAAERAEALGGYTQQYVTVLERRAAEARAELAT